MIHAHPLLALCAVEHAFVRAWWTTFNNNLAQFVSHTDGSALAHVGMGEFFAGEVRIDAFLEGLVHITHHKRTCLQERVAASTRSSYCALFASDLLISGEVATDV